MMNALFGNSTVGLVLLYLERHRKLYATEVAKGLGIPVNMVQKQCERLERGGILVSKREDRKRIYRWDAHFSLLAPLRQLLARANAFGAGDPADGRHLTLVERLTQVEALWLELEQLRSSKQETGFAISFNTWRDYERWKKIRSRAA